MLLSISSLWQQEPTVCYVRGGLLLALSQLLEECVPVVPPPVPVGGGGYARSKWGQPSREQRGPRRYDDEEIVEIMAMIAKFL